MSYEIPSELQYREKIVFGLTMQQLAWALLFGTPALFVMLKTQLAMPFKITLVTVCTAFAVLFMFCGAFGWLRHILAWWQMREFEDGEPEMAEFLPVTYEKSSVLVGEEPPEFFLDELAEALSEERIEPGAFRFDDGRWIDILLTRAPPARARWCSRASSVQGRARLAKGLRKQALWPLARSMHSPLCRCPNWSRNRSPA